jgi:hypothetical protein
MDPQLLHTIEAAKEATTHLIEACRKNGHLYRKNPKAVAQVNRTGKWLLNALGALRKTLDNSPTDESQKSWSTSFRPQPQGAVSPMSHIVKITTRVKDTAAVHSACQRLNLPEPSQGTTSLFSGEATGLIVKLDGWQYPIVINTEDGTVQFDNFNGIWGEKAQLDRFLQAYAVEVTKQQARKKGFNVSEQALEDGSIRLQIIEGSWNDNPATTHYSPGYHSRARAATSASASETQVTVGTGKGRPGPLDEQAKESISRRRTAPTVSDPFGEKHHPIGGINVSEWLEKRTIAIVSACMKRDGQPDLVLNEVAVTQEEAENGIHYYLVEAQLLEAGYEEPFVHFAQDESPSFLHPAVRNHLGLPSFKEPLIASISEQT